MVGAAWRRAATATSSRASSMRGGSSARGPRCWAGAREACRGSPSLRGGLRPGAPGPLAPLLPPDVLVLLFAGSPSSLAAIQDVMAGKPTPILLLRAPGVDAEVASLGLACGAA